MKRWQSAMWFTFAAAAFGLAYTQAPLFYSNQNQYFLHGLAQAGRGMLGEDWLANTADPTPVFSALVAGTVRFLDDQVFHLYYLALFGVYAVSLVGTWSASARPAPSFTQRLALLAGLVLVHSALLRWLSCEWFGVDYPWYLQAGLAGQYLLGGMLQPSVFGVFLLLSIWLFVQDRPVAAGAAASLAGTLHFTYLLGGGVLVLSYLAVLARERRWRTALGTGLLALGLVLPAVSYIVATFEPATPETADEARAILVHFRIPHHTDVERFLDEIALLQIAWMLLGAWLARGSRLFPVMVMCLAAGAGLTLAQWLSQDDLLALLFPWRLSVYLVPLATALVIGRIVTCFSGSQAEAATQPSPDQEVSTAPPAAEAGWTRRLVQVASVAILVGCAAAGVWIMENRQGYLRNDDELAVYDFVRSRLEPGQTYLIPYRLPARPGPRGSRSNDFLMEDDRSGKRIPLDMQRFRLHALAPILVDYKAIPYRDTEVLEWRRRLDVGLKIYGDLEAGKLAEALPALQAHGVTHVVMLRSRPVSAPQLQAIFQDASYVIYRLEPENPGG